MSNSQKINIIKRIRRGEKFIWAQAQADRRRIPEGPAAGPERGNGRDPGFHRRVPARLSAKEDRRAHPGRRGHRRAGAGRDRDQPGFRDPGPRRQAEGPDRRPQEDLPVQVPGAAGAGPRHPPEHRRRPAVLRGKGTGGRGRSIPGGRRGGHRHGQPQRPGPGHGQQPRITTRRTSGTRRRPS